MRPRHPVVRALAIGLLAVASTELPAQVDGTRRVERSNEIAEDVARRLRTKGHARYALDLLTQTNGPHPRELLDEIADTLANIAISHPGTHIEAFQIRSEASTTLLLAGITLADSDTGSVGGRRRVVYAGSAERLMRIVTDAQDPGLRGGTLHSLPEVLDTEQLLPFLRQVATSQNSAAFEAIVLLNELTGPEGVAMLRELHQKGLITEPNVQHLLRRIRWARGWAAPVR